MSEAKLSNVRPFPQRSSVAGADRITLREQDPYQFAPTFERQVVYLLCNHGRFFDAMAPKLQHKLFSSRIPQLLVDAAQATGARLQHAPQDFSLVLETLASYVRDGKATEDELFDARQYLEETEDAGMPSVQDIHALLVPTLQERVQLALMRQSRESFGARRGIGGVEALVRDYHDLKDFKTSQSLRIDAEGAARIKELLTQERMTVGVPTIDENTQGGFYVGTTTNFIGGTSAGKSSMLVQAAMHMCLVKKVNVTYATTELATHLQLARCLANALNCPYTQILENPDRAVDMFHARYPNAGKLEIEHFDAAPESLEKMYAWREEQQQKYGVPFRGNVLDYLTNMSDDYKLLNKLSKKHVEYAAEKQIHSFIACAPKGEYDAPTIRNKNGGFKLPINNGLGGAYAISKNVDTNIWLLRVAESEEALHTWQIYPICIKDRLGCSGVSFWKGKPLVSDFSRMRIDIETTHDTSYVTKPEEVPNF